MDSLGLIYLQSSRPSILRLSPFPLALLLSLGDLYER